MSNQTMELLELEFHDDDIIYNTSTQETIFDAELKEGTEGKCLFGYWYMDYLETPGLFDDNLKQDWLIFLNEHRNSDSGEITYLDVEYFLYTYSNEKWKAICRIYHGAILGPGSHYVYLVVPEDAQIMKNSIYSDDGEFHRKYFTNPLGAYFGDIDDFDIDESTLIILLAKNENYARRLPSRFVYHRGFWLKVVSANGFSIRFLPSFFSEDREIALKAVKTSPLALRYCHSKFLSDPEIVRTAIEGNPILCSLANPLLFEQNGELASYKRLLTVYGNYHWDFVFAENTPRYILPYYST